MDRKHAVSVIGGLTLLAGVTVAAWRPVPLTRSQQIRQAAAEWVATHRAALPTDFETFALHPYAVRKQMSAELSWETREALWRAQVNTFLAPADSLSATQRSMVAALGSPLTADERALLRRWLNEVVSVAYKPGMSHDARATIASPLCEAAKTVLGQNRSKIVLGQIGPVDTAFFNLVRSEAIPKPRTAMVPFVLPVDLARKGLMRLGLIQSFPLCTCNVSSLCDCGSGLYCVNSNCVEAFGCGCGEVFKCDGVQCAAG